MKSTITQRFADCRTLFVSVKRTEVRKLTKPKQLRQLRKQSTSFNLKG